MKQPNAETRNLCPEQPAAEPAPGQQYRLQQINYLKRQLEEERDGLAALYKKYRRGVNATDDVDTALLTASMAMGIGGVGLQSTIVAVLGLEAAALACGLLGVAGKAVSLRLAVKAKKHAEIRVLALGKLNTISDRVSTALVDGEISNHEFHLVLDEVETYHKMKAQIRADAPAAVVENEETKTPLSDGAVRPS